MAVGYVNTSDYHVDATVLSQKVIKLRDEIASEAKQEVLTTIVTSALSESRKASQATRCSRKAFDTFEKRLYAECKKECEDSYGQALVALLVEGQSSYFLYNLWQELQKLVEINH